MSNTKKNTTTQKTPVTNNSNSPQTAPKDIHLGEGVANAAKSKAIPHRN